MCFDYVWEFCDYEVRFLEGDYIRFIFLGLNIDERILEFRLFLFQVFWLYIREIGRFSLLLR